MSSNPRLQSPHDHVFLGDNHARNERRTWVRDCDYRDDDGGGDRRWLAVRIDGSCGRRMAHVDPRGGNVDRRLRLHVRPQECSES